MAVLSKNLPDLSKMDNGIAIKKMADYIRYMSESLEYAVSSRWSQSQEGISEQVVALNSSLATTQSSLTALRAAVLQIQSDLSDIGEAIESIDQRVTALENPET